MPKPKPLETRLQPMLRKKRHVLPVVCSKNPAPMPKTSRISTKPPKNKYKAQRTRSKKQKSRYEILMVGCKKRCEK